MPELTAKPEGITADERQNSFHHGEETSTAEVVAEAPDTQAEANGEASTQMAPNPRAETNALHPNPAPSDAAPIQMTPNTAGEAETSMDMEEEPEEEEVSEEADLLQTAPAGELPPEPPEDEDEEEELPENTEANGQVMKAEMGGNHPAEAMEEEEEVQAQSADGQTTEEAPPDVEDQINDTRGTGQPLESDVQREMGQKMGADFSSVNIHTGQEAQQMNRQLGAKAFTTGNDIYFNSGQYDPESSSGKHLLAHELTHTLQQAGTAQPSLIQKEDGDNGDDEPTSDPPRGVRPEETTDEKIFKYRKDGVEVTFNMNESPRKLTFSKIRVPNFKRRNKSTFDDQKPFQYPRTDRDTDQVNNWKADVRSGAESGFNSVVDKADSEGGRSRDGVYFFKPKRGNRVNTDLLVTGNEETLKSEYAEIPFWGPKGNPTNFQVDHIVENQMGGNDSAGNYELLEAGANASSGSRIANEISSKITDAISVFKSDYYSERGVIISGRLGYIKDTYNIVFEDATFNLASNDDMAGHPEKYWPRERGESGGIKGGEHWKMLRPLSGTEIEELGDEADFKVFASPSGGNQIENVPTEEGADPVQIWPRVYARRLVLTEGEESSHIAHLQVDAYKSGQEAGSGVSARYSDMVFYLTSMPGIYGGGIDKQATLDAAFGGGEDQPSNRGVFQSLRLPGLSPIEIIELDIQPGKGFVGRGKVLPTVPMIGDANIELIIDGAEFRIRKLFETEEIKVPPPFQVTNSSLEIFYSNQRGLGVEGQTDFAINQVGEGHVGAAASTSGGFELEGAFNFDSDLFDPAEISVEYKENVWTIGGEIGIPEGKVRGVKSATITATYSENNLTASGEAELDIPGIERGTMNIEYGEQGFSIGGSFDVSSDVPGIRSGRVEATVSKQQAEEDYSVSVTGTAQPDIPGIDTELSISYVDGAITIEGSAAYDRGMLSGTVQVGATNRAINDDGDPEGEPDDTMRVYGGGSLTLQLTPWLEATAGVRFLPNGEIEVQGRIGLPDTVDVFPRKEFNRNLFRAPTLEIPLFAIPLGPRSIGLVAQIGGGLDFSAGFGPGQLRELSAEVTYNPDREEETTVHGRGEFAIPADAGLTLRGDLGLGVSVGIASLTGGIELTGTLGLEGEAAAEVDVNWSPQTGIALDAEGRVTVNPKFAFAVNAFARASLDLYFTSISKTWRHNLAGFEWGPDIQFGIVFPIHYREDEPFDISFDDIEVIYPELDIPTMAKGLASDIKDDFID